MITKPRLSLAVAIPAHNEETSIAKTVRSILLAGIPRQDIFVLVNGSTDRTADEVRTCGVTPYVLPSKGKEETLNYAIHNLGLFWKYTHVCFFDADTVVYSGYFRLTRVRLKENPEIDVICGRPKSLPHNWLTAHRAVQYWQFHIVHKSAQGKIGSILVVPGCAGTYSTNVLREIRWSGDTRIGDMDMTIEAVLKGKKIAFEPRAVVYTQDPSNIRDYFQQLYRRWYRGLWMNMGKHGLLWKGIFSRLHWDCRLMFVDQFTLVIVPLFFLVFGPHFHLHYPVRDALEIFVGTIAVETLACAHMENRWDIIKYLPLFPFLRLFDTLLFIGAMPSIFVKREKTGEWHSPQRYNPAANQKRS